MCACVPPGKINICVFKQPRARPKFQHELIHNSFVDCLCTVLIVFLIRSCKLSQFSKQQLLHVLLVGATQSEKQQNHLR